MSKLRPELTNGSWKPCMTNGTAYFMILQAVKSQPGLIHGKLDGPYGEHCAIGSYFDINDRTSLPNELVDEVAAVNDSMPTVTPRVRKLRMVQWLRWKLNTIGMPGYARAQKPVTS